MIDYHRVIDKYYPAGSLRREIYLPHCRAVSDLAMNIAARRPELGANPDILEASAMLHDIGIFLTHAPEIGCFGDLPYLAHGYKGRELLESEGLNAIAPVCERHIGVGISLEDIEEKKLPLPLRDMTPQTIEEKIVCYADKFFSKSSGTLLKPKPMEKIRKSISRYGEDKWRLFEEMMALFGIEEVPYSDGSL